MIAGTAMSWKMRESLRAGAGALVWGPTCLWIASASGDLARDQGCGALFLPNGVPPLPPGGAVVGAPPRLKWPALAATLRTIAEKGPRALYEGSRRPRDR